MSIFLGVDVGGTSLTAAAVDDDGRVVGVARRAGVNPFAAGALAPLEAALGEAVRDLIGAGTPASVRGLVVGLAGGLAVPEAGAAIGRVTSALGIEVEPRVVNDAEAIFASGSASADGHVVAAGTGAIAVAVRDQRLAWRADGHGWLLGDEGSAVWIGFAAVRSVLAHLDGRGEPTSLGENTAAALGELAGRPCAVDPVAIVRTVHELAPAFVGRLAPVVDRHADAGDAVARRILDDAAAALGTTLAAVIRDHPEAPIVLGGAVIHRSATVRRALEQLVRQRWPRAALTIVHGGAAGAALWARRAAGRGYDDDVLQEVRRRVEMSVLDLGDRN